MVVHVHCGGSLEVGVGAVLQHPVGGAASLRPAQRDAEPCAGTERAGQTGRPDTRRGIAEREGGLRQEIALGVVTVRGPCDCFPIKHVCFRGAPAVAEFDQ